MEEATMANTDPVIREALLSMAKAARDVLRARANLSRVVRDLERHPDFVRAESARKAARDRPAAEYASLAWWVHDYVKGVVEDGPLGETARLLLCNSRPKKLSATMRLYVEQDRRDRARFARRAS